MEPTAGDSGQMIAAGEPLVFLRPREGEARQEGLACVTYFCGHPGCDCQDALLVAFRLDDRFPELRVERGVAHLELEGALEELQDRGAPRLEAVANLDDGSVEASGPAPLGELQLELLGWLREGMDASVLETLRTRWQLAKGTAGQAVLGVTGSTWRDRDWTWWDGEGRIAWADVFPATPEERYDLDGRTYGADDLYCLGEGCQCHDVTVQFLDLTDAEEGEFVGAVDFVLPGGEVVGTENPPGERQLLDRLWAAFAASRDFAVLESRRQEMRRLAPEIRSLRSAQGHPEPLRREHVGRNDPCPCGSGKKYKRCCLVRPN
jgi:hypothetical protein